MSAALTRCVAVAPCLSGQQVQESVLREAENARCAPGGYDPPASKMCVKGTDNLFIKASSRSLKHHELDFSVAQRCKIEI